MAIYGRLGRSRDKIKTFERAKKPLLESVCIGAEKVEEGGIANNPNDPKQG
jgi:hypothetical protein